MGVRILIGQEQGSSIDMACLFCSVTGTVFGPIIYGVKDLAAEDVAEQFLDWHWKNYHDPRRASGYELEKRYMRFRKERDLFE